MSNRKNNKPPVNRKLEGARLANGSVAELGSGMGWHVASRTGKGSHLVTITSSTPISEEYACTCKDFTTRQARQGKTCAHICAVIIYQRASAHAARAASSGTVMEEIAATTARAALERDAFTRYALLCLLAALGYQNDLAYALEYSRAA